MEDTFLKDDLYSMLEFEAGFKARFILDQQCRRMGIGPDDISRGNVAELVENIFRALSVSLGRRKSEGVYQWVMEYVKALADMDASPLPTLQKARAFVTLGDKRFHVRNFEGSMGAYRDALLVLLNNNRRDLWLECRVKRKLARVLSQAKSHYEDAKMEYRKVIELGAQINDHYDTALAYLGLGSVHWLEDDSDLAQENYNRAWVSLQSIDTQSREERERAMRVESLIHSAFADMYLGLQDMEQSVAHNEKAIAIQMELENYLGVERLYAKMRAIYQQKKDVDIAVTMHRGVAFDNGYGSNLMEGWTRMNLASLMIESGNYSQAEEHLSKAYDLLSAFDYPEAQSKLHCVYGKYYYGKRDLEASESHYMKSLEALGDNAEPECFARAREGLAALYMCKGDKEKGCELLRSALVWHERNNNLGEVKRINELISELDGYCPIGIALL